MVHRRPQRKKIKYKFDKYIIHEYLLHTGTFLMRVERFTNLWIQREEPGGGAIVILQHRGYKAFLRHYRPSGKKPSANYGLPLFELVSGVLPSLEMPSTHNGLLLVS